MYRILVVDDEPLIARSIQQMITKTSTDFTVCDVAYDGLSALEKVSLSPPDVVFTDIRMPVMDGLALTHTLHLHHPQIQCVILSGYNEFTYAQTAIREGVRAYLPKPLERTELFNLLSTLKEELDAAYHAAQQQTLYALLHREPVDTTAAFEEGPYLAVMIYPGVAGFADADTAAFYKTTALLRQLSEVCAEKDIWVQRGVLPGEKLLLLRYDATRTPEITSALWELYARLSKNVPITLTGRFLPHPDADLLAALHRQLLRQQLFGQPSLSLPNQPVAEGTPVPGLTEEETRTLTLLLRKGWFHDLTALVLRILERLQAANARQTTTEHLLHRILSLLTDELSQSQTLQTVPDELDSLLGRCRCWKDLLEGMPPLLERLYRQKQQTDLNSLPQRQLIDQVRSWLDLHYCEPVTVADLAEQFGLVPSYLSRLFKEYTSTSVVHYVQQLRLAKAEDLLRLTPPLSLRQIAETTGFSDQFYFSKVFKQTHNQTPAAWRTLQEQPEA